MRDLLTALLITLAVALAALGLWLGFTGPVMSGAQGFATWMFIAAGAMVLRARRIRPERRWTR
jgi:hypothetical protein